MRKAACSEGRSRHAVTVKSMRYTPPPQRRGVIRQEGREQVALFLFFEIWGDAMRKLILSVPGDPTAG